MLPTIFQNIANTIRGISIDAIAKANSGHPGLPLGCAEIAAYLYAKALQQSPNNPKWENRDRFVLSAGHGSMLQYAALHISGFNLSLENLKNFRQIHSPTPGHPEYNECPGIETSTGPLGQGFAHAVGMALAEKMKRAYLNLENSTLLDNVVVALAGDGCLMEGISAEASSLAGHLNLNNLIVFYDSNQICLDGPTNECFTENVQQRYEAYGWHTLSINGHNFEEIDTAYTHAKKQNKPTLIIAKTTIGFGSPNFAGTNEVHGKPLTSEEIALTKKRLNLPESLDFYVSEEVTNYFKEKVTKQTQIEKNWKKKWEQWSIKNPEKAQLLETLQNHQLSSLEKEAIISTETKPNLASRASSNAILQTIKEHIPYIIGGSADLSCSDSTFMKGSGIVSKTNYAQRNIKYGVREFAMGAIATGISLHGTFKPYIGTFFTFSDYMKNAIRLSALMNIPVIYQFTHDSIFLGEDGPTHQPIEHLASLRSIPNVTVIRPCDTKEVKGAWIHALSSNNPVAIICSRQGLADLSETLIDGVEMGAYIIKHEKESNTPTDYTLLATGSEISLALEVASQLDSENKNVRVVSMPSFELFEKQSKHYQKETLGNANCFVSIEAQTSFGWHKYIGKDGIAISIDRFGLSAPEKDLRKEFGFTKEQILEKLKTKNSA